MLATILEYVTWDNIASVVLAASLFCKGAEIVVRFTPGKGDDKAVAKAIAFLDKVSGYVGKLAINPAKPK